MFDIGWSEFFVIGLLALLLVGPQKFPSLLHSFGVVIARLRAMAGMASQVLKEAAHEANAPPLTEKKPSKDAQKKDATNNAD